MKNEKKTTWVFLLYKYSKFWSVFLEFKLEHKPFNLEVCPSFLESVSKIALVVLYFYSILAAFSVAACMQGSSENLLRTPKVCILHKYSNIRLLARAKV